MDLLLVAREAPGAEPGAQEISDPADAREILGHLPHGPHLQQLLVRVAVGALVLDRSLDRQAARAAIGVALQRSRPRGALVLGHELGRELFGEGLHLAGGIRELHSKSIGILGQANHAEIERIVEDLCKRASVVWAPPGARAAPARTFVRAEEVEALAAQLMEHSQWSQAIEALRAAEPLQPRGTNMLARALLNLGDRQGARHAFQRTLMADPLNAIAQRQLAQLGDS